MMPVIHRSGGRPDCEAILSGKRDTDKIAVIIVEPVVDAVPNYIGFIRRALKKAGYAHIPVISINKLEGNPGFKICRSHWLSMIVRLYSEMMHKCVCRLRPYEGVPGSVNISRRNGKNAALILCPMVIHIQV